MNTKMKFQAMENALPFISEISSCKTVKAFKEKDEAEKHMPINDMMHLLMPAFLTEKREAVFGLLGAISGKTVEEIEKQDWEETKELLKSPILSDLYDFFIFAVRMAKIYPSFVKNQLSF